ncbi:MAG: dUTP diphosphatase [Desulfomicrobiaceae bacterium]
MHSPSWSTFPGAPCPVRVRFFSSLYGAAGLCPATAGSCGLDLRACMAEATITLVPGARHPFPTGIAVEPLMPGVAGFVYSRSGLGARQGLVVAQGVGVIDPDFRGEITVMLLNLSQEPRTVTQGMRIAQLVFQPVIPVQCIPVSELTPTERGAGGFGHTGTH